MKVKIKMIKYLQKLQEKAKHDIISIIMISVVLKI